MIVCSCNVVLKSEIEEVVRDFLEQDAWQLVTVGMVYHAMAKRGKCCGCFPNAIAVIVETVEAWHCSRATPEADVIPFIRKTKETLEGQERTRSANRALKINRAA